nr:MaoC/PaaZ C-terminal domain-containing protein [Nakamurella lactea]
MTGTTGRTAAAVSVGDALPELAIPLTRSLIVAGALATRDYENVHHDPQGAIDRGTPDVYMSINNTNGLVGRFVTDWTGPGAFITKLSTRLGVPNFPGDTMTLAGEVVGKQDNLIEISVRGTNGAGSHVVSQVSVRLPDTAAPDTAAPDTTAPDSAAPDNAAEATR